MENFSVILHFWIKIYIPLYIDRIIFSFYAKKGNKVELICDDEIDLLIEDILTPILLRLFN